MPTIWTYLRATAVVVGSSAALLTGGIAHADPVPAPAPDLSAVAGIPQQLIASAANAPQILQNLATALGATPPAAPAAPGITFPGLTPAQLRGGDTRFPAGGDPVDPRADASRGRGSRRTSGNPYDSRGQHADPGINGTGGTGSTGSTGSFGDSGVATVHPGTHHPCRTCLRRRAGVRSWGGEG